RTNSWDKIAVKHKKLYEKIVN
ncbi:hypothetical protein LCGC14_2660680, partial [marine sediment metagenome]